MRLLRAIASPYVISTGSSGFTKRGSSPWQHKAGIDATLADLTTFDAEDLVPEDYQDLGAEVPFELEAGEGECAS